MSSKFMQTTVLVPVLFLLSTSVAWCQSPPIHETPAPATQLDQAEPEEIPAAEGEWIRELELRLRGESWDWFTPTQGDNDYAYAHTRLRARLGYRVPKEWEALVEVQDVQMINAPALATGPGNIGQMGLGGTLFGHSNRTSINTAGIRQAYIKVGNPDEFQLQLGRMEYASGLQVLPKDPVLAQVKRMRISGRLLGTFDFSAYGRTFDGLRLDGDSGDVHVTAFAARPTQGGFEPHFATSMSDLNVAELSMTLKQGEVLPDGEAQLFWTYYDDHRLVPQLDNRSPSQRGLVATTGGNQINTAGLHLVHRLGEQGDFLLWYAHQAGKWGNLSHQADAFSVEVGYQWQGEDWKPWLRGGYSYFSGDSNPNDGVHTTFNPLLPTIRPYAMLPFYTESNLRDAFAQLILKPDPQITARLDMHLLSLATPQDLWYVGSGATQNSGSINGFAGRSSGGGSQLGTLVDIGVDYQLDAQNKLSAYFGHVFGGDVPAASYLSPQANFFFLEYNLKLP